MTLVHVWLLSRFILDRGCKLATLIQESIQIYYERTTTRKQ